MQVREESVEQRTRVVAISGELDMAAAPAFEEKLLSCLAGEDPVILDLSDVGYMDSTAIGALISARKKANMTRGRFAVVVQPGDVERMLKITRLDTAFDIVETREEALARLALP
ncbi:MAG: anti-sigma factor antagonist [Thermoleophilaceae bacterium]|jgi:anti-anti-sigma factor|nr:anti-sigma factor antagonist [Thermoleophilaceae bacterium]